MRTYVQLAEAFEKLREVPHGTVAEDPGRTIGLGAEAFGQVGDQPAELPKKRLLGQPDRLVEAFADPTLLVAIERGAHRQEVAGRLNVVG